MEIIQISTNRDLTSLTVVDQKSRKIFCITHDEIIKIIFERKVETKLFSKSISDRISIETNTHIHPIYFKRTTSPEKFEFYRKELIKFAKDNKLELIDNLFD